MHNVITFNPQQQLFFLIVMNLLEMIKNCQQKKGSQKPAWIPWGIRFSWPSLPDGHNTLQDRRGDYFGEWPGTLCGQIMNSLHWKGPQLESQGLDWSSFSIMDTTVSPAPSSIPLVPPAQSGLWGISPWHPRRSATFPTAGHVSKM